MKRRRRVRAPGGLATDAGTLRAVSCTSTGILTPETLHACSCTHHATRESACRPRARARHSPSWCARRCHGPVLGARVASRRTRARACRERCAPLASDLSPVALGRSLIASRWPAVTAAHSAHVLPPDHREPSRCGTADRARAGSRRAVARSQRTPVPMRSPVRQRQPG
jgi:hypothetical protein